MCKNKSGERVRLLLGQSRKSVFHFYLYLKNGFRLGVCYLINASPLFSRELYIPMINIKMSSD